MCDILSDAGREDVEYKPLLGGPSNATQNVTNGSEKLEVNDL